TNFPDSAEQLCRVGISPRGTGSLPRCGSGTQRTTVFCLLTTRRHSRAEQQLACLILCLRSTVEVGARPGRRRSQATLSAFPVDFTAASSHQKAVPAESLAPPLSIRRRNRISAPAEEHSAQKELHFKEEEERSSSSSSSSSSLPMAQCAETRPWIQKCNFESSCLVSVITRKFCPACRLAKCFKVGMKRESSAPWDTINGVDQNDSDRILTAPRRAARRLRPVRHHPVICSAVCEIRQDFAGIRAHRKAGRWRLIK
uniref:Nuclear receptor domain-containing protein n=1 Tax=Macrostomum lignano TaxID=282301 RepID=A0A1I8FGV1_9PLAT